MVRKVSVSAANGTHLSQTCRVGRASLYAPRRRGSVRRRPVRSGSTGWLRCATGSFRAVIERFSNPGPWGGGGGRGQRGRVVPRDRACPGTRSILLQLFSHNKFTVAPRSKHRRSGTGFRSESFFEGGGGGRWWWGYRQPVPDRRSAGSRVWDDCAILGDACKNDLKNDEVDRFSSPCSRSLRGRRNKC